MAIARVYQPIPLAIHDLICLDQKASHHLAHVLRAKINDLIVVFNGQGGEYHAQIKKINKKEIGIEIIEFIAREVESSLEICLAQAITHGEKMDFIVQKAVELGVNSIAPLMTEHCHLKNLAQQQKRWAHWQAVAISACEQCGRNRLPQIAPPQMFYPWLKKVSSVHRFILSPQQHKFNLVRLQAAPLTLLVGSEGGFSEKEVRAAQAQQFIVLNLGPRVLRAETAGLAGIAIFQAYWGDINPQLID